MPTSLVKRLLPTSVKQQIVTWRERWNYTVIKVFSSHRYLASFYYCFLSRQFDREHLAVLKGRLQFEQQQGLMQSSHTLLRRNIHRIEKGLIMRPRKAVFALDYIEATLGAFAQCCAETQHDPAELKWATDVLAAYFAAVDQSQLDPRLKQRYELACMGCNDLDPEQTHVPYRFENKINAPVSPEDFHALCIQRRSVRWFESRPVEPSIIEQAVSMATLAPSACNRQPFQFVVATEKAQAKKLINIPIGTAGFADNVPCTIVVVANLAHYPTERDRHLIYIDASLASMQLMLGLETLGLSSCPINWPDIEHCERKMVKALDLKASERPVMLIAVGYALAEGEIPFSQKKTPQQLIKYVN